MRKIRVTVSCTRASWPSYGGQLLEITFISTTYPNPVLKDKIDMVIESVRLEDDLARTDHG
jgi:hypothetical protein